MSRPLLVVADDYGLAPAVDRAILQLARQRRIGAVSCLTNGPAWASDAAALRAAPVRAGLHLNLTEGEPLSPELRALWPRLPPLPRLLLLAHAGRLPLAAVRSEWQAQLAAFQAAYGAPPAHLDGHQHVHHLPGLRGVLLALVATLPQARVRDTGHAAGPGWLPKRVALALTGGRALSRRLGARSQNRVLLGAYDFRADYRHCMQRWLASVPPAGALLFCHPGEPDAGDAIAAARVREFGYLRSNDFAADLQAAGVTLTTE